MRRIDELFSRYGESHRNRTNKAIHWICVPLITWSLLAALWAWTPLAACALIAVAVVFYVALSLPIAIGMLAVSGAMVLTVMAVTGHLLAIAIVVFITAWIGQFVGHRIEGKKPLVLPEESLKVQQVLDAIYASAASGKEVRLG